MRIEQAFSYPVSIFMAGDYDLALRECRSYCDEVGLCVTVTPTTYVYTGGSEVGFLVGLINYPRFPTDPHDIIDKASALADRLREGLAQESYSIQTPERTIWRSWRAVDRYSDGTRSAETACPARSLKDCQARPEGIAQPSAGDLTMTNTMQQDSVERVAQAIYAVRPFVMVSTATTFGHQLAQSFDWDGAPAYYQSDMLDLARAAIAAMPQDEIVGELVEALTQAADAMTCRRDDDAHYCPNCDNSLHDARDKTRAALAKVNAHDR